MDGFLGFCFTQFNAMIVLPVNDSSSNLTTRHYKNVRFVISLLPFFDLSFSSHWKKKRGNAADSFDLSRLDSSHHVFPSIHLL